MCWTTSTGSGKSAGRPASTASSARGPPVEAQIPTTVAVRAARDGGGRTGAVAVRRRSPQPPQLEAQSARAGRPLRVVEAHLRLRAAPRARPRRAPPPASSERPRGRCRSARGSAQRAERMISSIARMPPMPGSSRSIVTRSGLEARGRPRAPPRRSRTRRPPRCRRRARGSGVRPRAYVAESSQTRMRRRAATGVTAARRRPTSRAAPAGRTPSLTM